MKDQKQHEQVMLLVELGKGGVGIVGRTLNCDEAAELLCKLNELAPPPEMVRVIRSLLRVHRKNLVASGSVREVLDDDAQLADTAVHHVN